MPRQWPALTFDLDVDVCVVGGGLAGLDRGARDWRGAAGRWPCWKRAGSPGTRRAAIAALCCRALRPDVDTLRRRVAGSTTPRRCGRCRKPASIMSAPRSRRPPCRASSRSTAGSTSPRSTAATTMWRACALLGQEFGAEVEGWPTERVRDVLNSRPLFSRDPLPERLPHSSAQLCARSRRGRGSGGRAYLRGDAGARHRSGAGCASASPPRPRACAPITSCSRATPTSALLGPDLRNAGADVDLCRGHGAARRPVGGRDQLSRRRSAISALPTTITASSTATA